MIVRAFVAYVMSWFHEIMSASPSRDGVLTSGRKVSSLRGHFIDATQ